jgi:aldose 1-epimerase
MEIKKEKFGVLKDGTKIDLYVLKNKNGMTAKITNYGANLTELHVPDRQGSDADVVLGFDTLEEYTDNTSSFGSVVGRYANRIAKASFELNGTEYKLDANNGENSLHGGFHRYNTRVWKGEMKETKRGAEVILKLMSPDKDQGYPGNLEIVYTYVLTEENELMMEYYAKCDQDTVVNLTNHSYFNLAGHNSGTVLNHKVWIDSDYFTPVSDKAAIPTGEIRPVKGTPMDFNEPKTIGRDIDSDYEQVVYGNGFDHNWVLKTSKGNFGKIAELIEENSGRVMEVYTDMAGVQFYTGNFLDGSRKGKGGYAYGQRAGACFETQYYPDSVHHDNFPSPVLRAGEEYRTSTVYKFIIR